MFIHPDEVQARSITIKEATLLQSFPNDYEFVVSLGSYYKMMGNTVPPELERKIAIGIGKVISNKYKLYLIYFVN